MSIEDTLARYTPELEQELQDVIHSGIAQSETIVEPLYGMLRYHLGWVDENLRPTTTHGGKRIRPVICLLSCEACGGDYRRALAIAASIELVHNFTLIHDDIQDRSVERRHRPSVWALWGDAQAINAGDALYSIASLGVFRSIARGLRSETTLAAARALHSTLLSVCEGQYLDIAFECRNGVTTEMYLAMISRKTSDLIACAAQLGANTATEDTVISGLYRDFGHALGMAFQMQDDILGIWGETAVTGKPVGDDIYRRKKTLPVLYALENAGDEDRRRLDRIFVDGEVTSEDVEAATEILSRIGAREYAEKNAQHWFDQAIAALEQANPHDPAGLDLRQLAESLIGRSS